MTYLMNFVLFTNLKTQHIYASVMSCWLDKIYPTTLRKVILCHLQSCLSWLLLTQQHWARPPPPHEDETVPWNTDYTHICLISPHKLTWTICTYFTFTLSLTPVMWPLWGPRSNYGTEYINREFTCILHSVIMIKPLFTSSLHYCEYFSSTVIIFLCCMFLYHGFPGGNSNSSTKSNIRLKSAFVNFPIWLFHDTNIGLTALSSLLSTVTHYLWSLVPVHSLYILAKHYISEFVYLCLSMLCFVDYSLWICLLCLPPFWNTDFVFGFTSDIHVCWFLSLTLILHICWFLPAAHQLIYWRILHSIFLRSGHQTW